VLEGPQSLLGHAAATLDEQRLLIEQGRRLGILPPWTAAGA